jgi:hypothetical protein
LNRQLTTEELTVAIITGITAAVGINGALLVVPGIGDLCDLLKHQVSPRKNPNSGSFCHKELKLKTLRF